MKTYHIYTDASVGRENKEQYSICGVIVVDSHILDIYYKNRNKLIDVNVAERTAIRESVQYTIKTYNANDIIVHSDSKVALKKPFKNVKFLFVKAHRSNKWSFKHKFNNLADYICKKGLDNWKNQWYNNIL